MRLRNIIVLVIMAGFVSACAKPAIHAREQVMEKVSRSFSTDANQAYYAVRAALKASGYFISSEDLQDGVIKSSWVRSKADSFYVAPFGHVDYIADGAYYRLQVNIIPKDGVSKVDIEVASHVKSVSSHLHSSGIYEKKVLEKIADYLRPSDIDVTNVGIEGD